MFRRPVAALSCALLFALAVPAAATTVTTTLSQTVSGNTFGDYGRTNVTISNGTSQTVIAGAFDVTSSVSLPDLGTRFAAWCLDIDRALKLGTQYATTTNPFSVDLLTLTQRRAIQTLFNIALGRDILRNAPTTNADPVADANSAGFQLALWEVVNETGSTYAVNGVNGGSFKVTSNSAASNAAEGVANDLLGQIKDWTQPNRVRLTFLESQDTKPRDGVRDSQNLVAFAPVPVPAAGALLLAALAGLGLARRRQVRNT
jgi:hypothetical protein